MLAEGTAAQADQRRDQLQDMEYTGVVTSAPVVTSTATHVAGSFRGWDGTHLTSVMWFLKLPSGTAFRVAVGVDVPAELVRLLMDGDAGVSTCPA
ncbi:hypothetical protein ACFP1Z_31520 [Streptomyces gamaensis]|uniref:Uncharacterized protein n=1 Tax=Streptomyces gamaensis TaxID=1763542 RepID=A0ABW0ZDQ2_9ACTN